jgi:hypothetical protein
LTTLRDAGGAIAVSVTAHGKPLNNLYVFTAALKNAGTAPIVPADILEKITLKTSAPWQIIAITKGGEGALGFSWRKISDTAFQAEPALINPGDWVWAAVYMTYLGSGPPPTRDGILMPPLEWSARITNLKSITPESELGDTISFSALAVSLSPVGVGVVLAAFSICFMLYLWLLHFNGALSPWRLRSVASVVVAAVLSISGAEAFNSYVMGNQYDLYFNALNAPILVVNVLCLAALFVNTRFRAGGAIPP